MSVTLLIVNRTEHPIFEASVTPAGHISPVDHRVELFLYGSLDSAYSLLREQKRAPSGDQFIPSVGEFFGGQKACALVTQGGALIFLVLPQEMKLSEDRVQSFLLQIEALYVSEAMNPLFRPESHIMNAEFTAAVSQEVRTTLFNVK